MATARVLNFGNSGPISVGSGFVPSPQGCTVPPNGSVNFTNNSGATITVTVTPASIFNIGTFTLPAGESQLLTAQVASGSVTYCINNNVQQPYAIQVGSGPMVVQIAGGSSTTYTPQFTAIVTSGALQMNGDQKYSIVWAGGQPVTPANLTTVFQGMSNNAVHTGLATAGQFSYNASPSGITAKMGGVGGGGGGKIIIRGA
jgi:hypothetical protein